MKLLIGLALLAACVMAEVNAEKGIAIDGYDTVAYFTDGKPLKGRPEFSHQWHGAQWLFVSQEHRKLFAANPDRYAPQYGGFCSMSMSKGQIVRTDPEAWKIISGKLYFVHDKKTLPAFETQAEENIYKANFFWPKFYK